MSDPHVIERIRKATIENFRGFKGEHTLDTDADIVVISGANGHGKSSLLEALCYLLTGWTDKETNLMSLPVPKVGGSQNNEGQSPNYPAPQSITKCRLAADVKWKISEKLTWEWSGDQSPPPLPEPYEGKNSLLQIKERDLRARLCAFFQDRMELLFDQSSRGQTLRDLFEPLLPEVNILLDGLQSLKEDLEKNQKSYTEHGNLPPKETLDTNLAQAWPATRKFLQDCQEQFRELSKIDSGWRSGWPPDWAIPEQMAGGAAMDDFAHMLIPHERYRELRSKFREKLTTSLESAVVKAREVAVNPTQRTEEIRELLSQIDRKSENIKKEYPNLTLELEHFAAESGLPDALAIFQSLVKNANRWHEQFPGDSADLRDVLWEIERVDIEKAGKCGVALDTWLKARKVAKSALEKLEQEKAQYEDELRGSQAGSIVDKLIEIKSGAEASMYGLMDAWEKYHEWVFIDETRNDRKKASDILDRAIDAVANHHKRLEDLTAPSEALMKDLQGRINRIWERFSLVEGLYPLHLEAEEPESRSATDNHRRYVLRTNDDRRLQHLSTGQKAQAAVSVLVAQNMAVSHWLHHRVILLDDVTTAYDLSNLTREAILWRQLAYGSDDEKTRRQIFISSHHEEMTSLMLDLLVPPPGKKMLLIRFTGWSNMTGPEYKTFEVEANADIRKQMETALAHQQKQEMV
ncbi:MAG: AAA family ATPase [Magnetococcus sp. WYHC-3]